jgi:hypothetical protein
MFVLWEHAEPQWTPKPPNSPNDLVFRNAAFLTTMFFYDTLGLTLVVRVSLLYLDLKSPKNKYVAFRNKCKIPAVSERQLSLTHPLRQDIAHTGNMCPIKVGPSSSYRLNRYVYEYCWRLGLVIHGKSWMSWFTHQSTVLTVWMLLEEDKKSQEIQ